MLTEWEKIVQFQAIGCLATQNEDQNGKNPTEQSPPEGCACATF
jgi:hypothetical protein